MTTRRQLTSLVYARMRDYNHTLANPLEIHSLLNEAQTEITDRASIIRRFRSIPLVSGTSSYLIPDTPGAHVGQILNVQVNDGTYDLYPLQQVDLLVMAEEVPTWRTDTGVPTAFMLGTDPTLTFESARLTDVLTTYPQIDLSGYSLKVTYSVVTNNQMRGDDIEPLLPTQWDDALVSYAVSEILLRNMMTASDAQMARYQTLADNYRARYEEMLNEAIAFAASSYGAQHEIPARRF